MYKKPSLPPYVRDIIEAGRTELPHSGCYNTHDRSGSYLCRQCGLALFRAHAKFSASCGWPSFDEELPDTIRHLLDADGRRTEIRCARCDAHLGHIFLGEGFTAKNTRYCVNSLALDFVEDTRVLDSQEALFAAGCFWGVEHLFATLPGVLATEVGYCGGTLNDPTYEQVCQGNTGHLEAVRVLFDPQQVSFEALCRFFFEIHDSTQADGQGPDKGSQYLSAIFYYDRTQQAVAQDLIKLLNNQGVMSVTGVHPASVFWPAESYHQQYYAKTGKQPYCHIRKPLFT